MLHSLYHFLSYLYTLLKHSLRPYSYYKKQPKELVETEHFIPYTHPNQKPEWVKHRIMYLKVHLPEYGCRRIAMQFNQMYEDKEVSVSKSYVYRLLITHSYEILHMRKEMRNRHPYPKQKNQLWQLDLTTIEKRQILGVVDSGTRALLALKHLQTKSSIRILRVLLDIIECYGRPEAIRSDNELVFTSKLMRFSLWLLRIKRQTTQIASPWQNGMIERLFGTMKQAFKNLTFPTTQSLESGLKEFRLYYNHIRPHQNLGYNTPANAWEGKPISTSKTAREIIYCRGLCDNVAGYYYRE